MQHAQITSAFEAVLLNLLPVFSAPSAQSFLAVAWGWVLCLGRPTMPRIVGCAGARVSKHVTSYNRLFSKAAWDMDALWRLLLTRVVVPALAPEGHLLFAADDTTTHRFGRAVAFAGWFRDAVRSGGGREVQHWSHCWVLLCLHVRLPLWPRHVISLPVMAALYRKEKHCDKAHPFRTRQGLLLQMISNVRLWLPGRELGIVADGAYPSEELVRALPPGVPFVSRIRRDAALYWTPVVPQRRRRGRPRQKGPRLPSLEAIARRARFRRARIVRSGREIDVLIHSFVALWWSVAKGRPIRVIIVRHPRGKEHDDFFFSTDPEADPAEIATCYCARWPLEVAIREAKQSLGFESVQGWCPTTVERQAPMALVLLTAVKVAYLTTVKKAATEEPPPFHAMLLSLRLADWDRRIRALSLPRHEMRQFSGALSVLLASAA